MARGSQPRPVRALSTGREREILAPLLPDFRAFSAAGVFRGPGHDARREEVMHMQKWMRSGLLSVGLAGAMVGGGAMVAHAQTNDSSSSSSDSGSSSTTTDNGSSSTTAPAQGTAPAAGAQGNCPNM